MKETIIRKRKIKIVFENNEMTRKQVNGSLNEKKGIIEVRLDEKKKVIYVDYDLLKVTFEEIEKRISNSGISLSNNLFDRWKRSWTRFTEQNELDNLSAKPTSCCGDPKSSSVHCEKR